jgi:hypothetical protein
MLYDRCFSIVESRVKPEREKSNRKVYRDYWWQYAEKRPGLFRALENADRVLVNARVAKHIIFEFLPANLIFLNTLHVFPYSTFDYFALLQSTVHAVWAILRTSSVGATPQYTPADCFFTFPFPDSLEKSKESYPLSIIGKKYHVLRSSLLAGGLTEIYNRFHNPSESSQDIQKLRDLHVEMDNAVVAAYGWTDLKLDHGFHETKQGIRYTISEPARREVLQRLLKLNHERYAEEEKQGLHGKKKTVTKKASKPSKKSTPKKKAPNPPEFQQPSLFDQGEGE